jgi:hypothetical protein
MQATVLTEQSIFDLAIQEAGTIEAAFAIAVANNISITALPDAGERVSGIEAIERPVTNYYANKGLIPATANLIGLEFEGIGYWGVEIDFIITKN